MDIGKVKRIWTIGHSTRQWTDFLSILQSFGIMTLVDIRAFPGSRKYPHYNKEHLEAALPASGITYLHVRELGGRRRPQKNSPNVAWRNEAFRGYADYMSTADFHEAIKKLEKIASTACTAYMCSEATWWRCHRALVSDYLKAHGWDVQHIMDRNKSSEHPFTSPAKVIQGQLFYS